MSTGKLVGYAYGKHVKIKILSDEGVKIINGKIISFDKKLFKF